MAELVRAYTDLMENKSDPRVNDWFLMSGPLPTIIFCGAYVYFVKVLGPRFMERRKPLEIRKILLIYNFCQVIFSTYLFYEAIAYMWGSSYNFRCMPVDYSQNSVAIRAARGSWWYYISKLTEFMDTIFFVFRKKFEQVSTLHVIHHALMPISAWLVVKFVAGGHGVFSAMLNTFVHIIMYTYYMLTAFGPKYQKYLWWKKYLTSIQMIQFVLVGIHTSQLAFTDCNYPQAFVWYFALHAVMFFFLFSDFYKTAYKKSKKSFD